MSSQVQTADGEAPQFYELVPHHHAPHGSTQIGFWIYLMSDCLIFASLFAIYGVLGGNYAAGPSPQHLFDLKLVAMSTAALLLSSITYGFAMLDMEEGKQKGTIIWLIITGLLGAVFMGFTLYEFNHLIHEGAVPQRSAFLSAFFVLVGTHALHVAFGILWLVILLVQIGMKGLIPANKIRVQCLSMFWHFLDVIWIGVFTVVYLMGMLR
ncbi:cytochrome o ubiquinol oxidase subunit 3 [Devosia crocina]|uniref:Cytochrome bo(3) ubiquinol oxidase subunit 3 n=1 Tax=Devosia crocina TaxID=429728 RepID=A0A1I7N1W4_9HYPH|nr:cytochrome o ubiquinol oxidase subunit III [Devosia crocina]SFV28615.1 cytochrome o ubiquinol oxidase subunit 3 [Devosia crocina]